ncbi:MAG TPA: hypothetical protein VFJ95_04065 [Gammaproteobacteria bacterium]|nr:hypothetical protein [Gammaproteobacteria bacterium]
MTRAFLEAACCTLALLACAAGAAAQDLPNPFARPDGREAPGSGRVQQQNPHSLELRATLVRGRSSSANIDGTIVRVGEKVAGYRLVSVHEGAAVLVDAAGITYVIELARSRQVAQ